MKYPAVLGIDDVLPMLDQFDTIIDARSESEFALDRIPGAINCPTLADAQRVLVGTTYKQVGAFWIGGVITDNGMFSLVAAEQEADIHEYGRILGFPEGDMVLRRVIRPVGPFFAQPRG